MTLVVGHKGSMGERYQAILRHLGEPFVGYDTKEWASMVLPDYSIYDRFIIATPTETHLAWVRQLDGYNKPILCEKPLSKNIAEVEEILSCKSPLSMTMQYKYLLDGKGEHALAKWTDYEHGIPPRSWYDYFRTGKDGLYWDCFQVIALAEGPVKVQNASPTWTCAINGQVLSIKDMDNAYVENVKDFLSDHYLDRSDLLRWHLKVKEYAG